MGSISVRQVTKQFGSRIVLDGVSLEVHTGETVGVVGPNGAGKTTLFKLMTGAIEPDSGTITISRGLKLGYLAQEPPPVMDSSLHDEVAGAFEDLFALEHKLHGLADAIAARHDGDDGDALLAQYDRVNAQFIASGGYAYEQKICEILGGLGFSAAEHGMPMSVLSGGQKCRAALAKLLVQDRQMLLLDEPTNHLDIDAVRWLEKFLAGHHGGALIVSHDRYLLDRLADRIVEVDGGRITSYAGNYSNYVATKDRAGLTQQRQFAKDAAFIEKERAFIAKHLAGQRTKEAQGRRSRLERRLAAGEFVTERPSTRRRLAFAFEDASGPRGTVLRVEGLAKSYDNKRLFADLDLQIDAGRRCGITGPNGTGKTTLLKILLGQVAADAGTYSFSGKTRLGYYAQDGGALAADRTVLEEIRAVRPGLGEQEARDLLARFLFTGDAVFKKLDRLSGGEQSRIRLLELLLESPNVLVLDEPTNHLDIAAREALEQALADFPGTIVVVSHDRYFLDRIVDQLLVIRPEGHRLHPGNYSAYVETLERERAGAAPSPAVRNRREQPKPPAGDRPARPTARFDALTLEALEAQLMEAEAVVAALNARFADPAVYQDAAKVADLRDEFKARQAELALIEAAWHERASEH